VPSPNSQMTHRRQSQSWTGQVEQIVSPRPPSTAQNSKHAHRPNSAPTKAQLGLERLFSHACFLFSSCLVVSYLVLSCLVLTYLILLSCGCLALGQFSLPFPCLVFSSRLVPSRLVSFRLVFSRLFSCLLFSTLLFSSLFVIYKTPNKVGASPKLRPLRPRVCSAEPYWCCLS
jgi:hypothetical protein